MTSFPSARVRDALPWLVVVGIVLVAFNLRGPIVAPALVIGQIQDEVGLSTTVAGLITGLPVLFFALATPLATSLIRRVGPELAVVTGLLGVLLGTVVRSAGGAATVLIGTALIGVAITVGNIVVPVIIRRDVPWRHASAVTGTYTAALNVGSMITSLGTAPLAAAVGWRWALLAWGGFAVVGMAFWLLLTRRRRAAAGTASAEEPAQPAPGTVSRIGWWLVLAFAGQAFSYYAVTAWLPTLLADGPGLDPSAAGAISAIFQVAAVVGAFGVPVLATRTPPWVPVAAVGLLWSALPVGLLAAPEAYVLWSFVGGVAQGGGFTAIFSIIARVTRTDRETASISARVQTGGYLAATLGPPVAGALYSATGGWTASLLVVLAATILYSAGGILAARLVPRRPGGGLGEVPG